MNVHKVLHQPSHSHAATAGYLSIPIRHHSVALQLSDGPGAPSALGSRGRGCCAGNGQCKGLAADPRSSTGDHAPEGESRTYPFAT